MGKMVPLTKDMENVYTKPARCPHCGYTPGVIPSDFDAYAQANCEHRGIHAKAALEKCSGCSCEHDEIHNPTDTCATCNGGSRYHLPKPAPAPLLTDNQLREQMPDKVRCAVEFFHDDRNSYGSVTAMWGHGQACTLHISDLTRRLAEVEAENGRFAEMLESSVSDWRKLYTEERAERVRIQGILLNDVQAEHQESDEHIKGLDTVIKTQDKTIRDLKSRVAEAEAERDALRERCEKLEWLVEVQEFVVYFDPTSTLDNACVELAASWKYAELCAAIAPEVKP